MDKKEKLLELLGRKKLSEAEQVELETIISSDEELGTLAKTYQQMEKIVNHSSHLDEEELAQYILYKNGIQADDNSIIKRVPFIEQHLRKCTECSELLKEFSSEYSEVDNFLFKSLTPEDSAETKPEVYSQQITSSRYKAPRYAFASILIVGLIYLVLYAVSTFTTPDYYYDAAIRQDSQFSINRGRATENFQNSLKALDQNNFDKAIIYLQKDIKENPGDNTIFYSYYLIGLSYLKTAESDFLGLFPEYNRDRVEKGSKYLRESIQKNDSGKFNDIKMNSYYYLGKASLMLKDKEEAKKYLKVVIEGRGSKMDQAKHLLGEME